MAADDPGPRSPGGRSLADKLSWTVDGPSMRGGEPALVVVKNTFFELREDCEQTAGGIMASSKSVPASFNLGRRSRLLTDAQSEPSTDTSDIEEAEEKGPRPKSTSSASTSTTASSRERASTRGSAMSADDAGPSSRDRARTRSSALSADGGPSMRVSSKKSVTLSIVGQPAEEWQKETSGVEEWPYPDEHPMTVWKTMTRTPPGSPRRTDKSVSFSEYAEVHHLPNATQPPETPPASATRPAEATPPPLPVGPPGSWTTPPPAAVPPWAWRGTVAMRFAEAAKGGTGVLAAATTADIVECVRLALSACTDQVACVVAKKGTRGWNITVYVSQEAGPVTTPTAGNAAKDKVQKKVLWDYVISAGQHAVLHATGASRNIVLLGFAAQPFTPMSLGFGCAVAAVDDPQKACMSSYSKGFCDQPGSCILQHPKEQVAINVMLKRARPQRCS